MLNPVRFSALFAAFLLPFAALADVELGTYSGTDASGNSCSFEVLSVTHEGGIHHPLHERVEILFDGATWSLGHPAEIDLESGHVRFNHDRLVASRGFAQGSLAAILVMDHSPGMNGPKELWILKDHYRDASQSSKAFCGRLTHSR